MSQTPQGGDYFSQDSVPSESYPADPYATPTTDYVASGGAYGATYDQGTTGTAGVAKDEAANVKNTAVQEGQQVAGTAKSEAANVAGTAKDEANQVKDTAVQAGQQVAGTAKDEATNVAVETGAQAKDIARQAVGELSAQAGTQKAKVAGLVHSYADELGSMAKGEGGSGPLTDLVQRASTKASEIGGWLEDREPRELLDELTSFARRRPGAFLLGASLAGVVVGRLTRNLAADAKDDAAPAPVSQGYSPSTYAAPTYSTPSSLTGVEQGGRYGDLASEDQVVGYDTPVRTTGYDATR